MNLSRKTQDTYKILMYNLGEDMSLNDTLKFEFIYNYTAEEIKTALTAHQKHKTGKKNKIFIVILLILTVNFFYSASQNIAQSHVSLLLAGVCLALIFIIYYNPKKYVKNMVEAINASKANENEYILSFYEEFFTSGIVEGFEQEDETFVDRFEYSDKNIFIYEINDLFLVEIGSEKVFVLPKRCLNEKEPEFKDLLRLKFEENYKILA